MGFPINYTTATLKVVTGSDPAANTELSDTVPAGKTWVLLSYSVALVQGATDTPWPALVITDGTSTVFRGNSGTAAMSTGTTTQHTWAPGLVTYGAAATTANQGPLPSGLVLGPGYVLSSVTAGKGSNTNYGAPSIFVIEYA